MKDTRKKALETRMRRQKLAGAQFDSKREALQHFHAVRDKKKIPRVLVSRSKEENNYKNMSIEDWENKYLNK
jgi:hypothetical protein